MGDFIEAERGVALYAAENGTPFLEARYL